MRQPAYEAEGIIAAKIAADFGRAVTVARLGAATARFGRTTATRLAALPAHPAYSKARGFTLDDVDHLAGDLCLLLRRGPAAKSGR
jgi:hypothetical protein